MNIRRILLICCLWVPVCKQTLAQVKFSTIVNQKEVGKNDYLQVEYMVENAKSVENITPPAFTGFTIASGPMQQNNMSVINGVISKSEGVAYILQPTSAGKKIIPGATAIIDGKLVRSNAVTVQVTNSSSPSSSMSPSPFSMPMMPAMPDMMPDVTEEYILKPGEDAMAKIKNNLLVKLDVSKTSCYIGQPIIATYKLCSRLKSESKVTRRPTLNGFSVYDMTQPEANNPTVEKINGKLFNVHIIRKVQLYPLQEGSFELDPAELDNTVHFIRLDASSHGSNRSSMQQMLDDYFNGMSQGKMEDQRITLASKPVTITVKSLPETGRPASFDGAVGKFSISASLDQHEIPADETAGLNVILKGEGNLTLINAPAVNWPQKVEAYEPSVKEDINKTVSPISGIKQFQYSFTVKQPGKLIIPPVEFSYFDPASNAYKTLHTDSMVLNVTKATSRLKKAIESKLDKIVPAVEEFNWLKLFWLLPVLVVIASGFIMWRKNKRKVTAPVAPVIAPVVVKDPFEAAKNALQYGDSQLFYKEVGRAIWDKLAEKLPVTSSQLNKPVVTSLLRQKGAPETTINALQHILLETEMALYTPVHSEHDMKASLERAEDVVRQVDQLTS